MDFTVDKQTLEDLNIPGKFNPGSVFGIFNRTRTQEGEQLLEKMFLHPLNRADKINERTALFRYFGTMKPDFSFSDEIHAGMEGYLRGSLKSGITGTYFRVCRKKLADLIRTDKSYDLFCGEVQLAKEYLGRFGKLYRQLDISAAPAIIGKRLEAAGKLLERPEMEKAINSGEETGVLAIARLDHLFRSLFLCELREIVSLVREMDVYTAVAEVARKKNFTYPVAGECTGSEEGIVLDDVYHPSLDKAVPNSLIINRETNVVFLTGANMAGKSTLMKSVGIAVYLAHLGLPVAARSMKFTPLDGLYTSINVPDNLHLGYSHFYAEVLRVKKVAEEVASGKKLLVVFDELFKGTNVKDAFDATVAVTRAFSEYRKCCFIISTHIIEAGHALRKEHTNFRYVYVPTVMKDGHPCYTYTLREGITDDRHGMVIVNNERIVEIIREAVRCDAPDDCPIELKLNVN